MSVVLTDVGGFAVDWDWWRGLTVWTVRGPRFDLRITEHQLAARPRSESRARRAALRWWRAQGRAQALSRAKAGSGRPLAVRQSAVGGLPGSGTPDELMEAAGISASRIAAAARTLVTG